MHGPEFDALSPAELADLRHCWLEREKRSDRRAGVVAATIANVNRDPKRRRQQYTPGDFFPILGQQSRRLPSHGEWVNQLAAATGGLPDDWQGWRPGSPENAD
ncbi:MAG TPA: hypothetical protein VK176_08300 [Phycisphaerales bacterium]|nr:hypothetical protein [Phycisphaerales bacterium]